MAGEEKKAEEDNAGKSQKPGGRKAATATARDSSVNPSLPGGGEEKKATEDNDGKSQQPVGSTAATTAATAVDSDSSVNSSLPGGARPPMASFPLPAAAAASASMNYNVQQSVTNAIPSHGQTGHQHGDALGTQQRRNAAVTAPAGNLKRQRLEQQGNFGFGYGQPPPPLPQQRDTRGDSRDQRMSGSFSQSSSAAPRCLIVLDPEPQSPTAIPGHNQTGHQHGVLGQQQRGNADTNAAATARAAANAKHQMLQQQGNFGFGYGQPPPPLPQQRGTRGDSRDQRMSGSFSQSSSAAPRCLIVLDPEPQSPTAIPGHSQTGHQHGVLGQQQRGNADTNAATTAHAAAAAAANVKHQMLQQQGNFVFGYWPQQPPPLGYLQQQPPPLGYLQQQPPPLGYLQQGPSSAGLPLLPMAARVPRTFNLLDRLAPLMCLACKIKPMRTLPYPDTMHHCVCEDCFRAGISCSNCHRNINLGQSSSSAALPQMLPQAGQASSQAPPVPDVQPTAAEAPETPLCWSCRIRSAPWTTYYPNVQEHSCVCLTCFSNGITACPLCPRRR